MLHLRRAWGRVLESEDPDKVTRLAIDLSRQPLPQSATLLRLAGVPPSLNDAVERTVRQTLLQRLFSNLMPGILIGLGSEGHSTGLAVPKLWRRWLEQHGIRVDALRGRIAYLAVVLSGAMRGARFFLGTLSWFARGKLQPNSVQPHDVFLDLPTAFLPEQGTAQAASIVPWLAERCDGRKLIIHSAREGAVLPDVEYAPSALPAFPNYRCLFLFMALSIQAAGVALIAAVFGKGELLLILKELVALAHARAVGPERLAVRYIGENSRWYHRPLFTEWARASANSQSILLFYATNMDECLRLRPDAPSPSFMPGYETMSWDGYMAWDSYHADLIEAWGQDRNSVEIVGAVPLGDRGDALPKVPGRTVAVFDIAPSTTVGLSRLGLVTAYYHDEIAATFVRDLCWVAQHLQITLLFKQKRVGVDRTPPNYQAAFHELNENTYAKVIHPGIAADRIVRQCDATVSMPFSSPSLLAKMAGQPACFYDPTLRLVASERQSHGLSVLSGRDELKAWLIQNVVQPNPSSTTSSNS